jgi:two-component system chemotaxis response regulator CheB
MSVLTADPAAIERAASAAPPPIRVMVVDDSAVVRGLVTRWLEEERGFKVVASLRTGREAVDRFERADPDVVILDIEMPELDGLSALPLLLEKKRDLVVLMASTVTRRNAEVSFKALALGAADYITKPESNRGITTSPEFRRALVEKVRSLGQRRLRRMGIAPAPPALAARPALAPAHLKYVADEGVTTAPLAPAGIKLRPWPIRPPRVLLIAASTGGPQALSAVISQLGRVTESVPVLVAQHIPPTFTTILAEHLTRATGRSVREALDGELISPGTVYIAPGGRHMLAGRRNGQAVITLDDSAPVNFCRPAVDPLFSSASHVWRHAALAIILTGMGADGTRGAEDMVAAGGCVIAQDEATSVVWGMPGSAAHAGLCSAVLPLDKIAPTIVRLFSGDTP